MKKILSLDIGINSIGNAVVELDDVLMEKYLMPELEFFQQQNNHLEIL